MSQNIVLNRSLGRDAGVGFFVATGYPGTHYACGEDIKWGIALPKDYGHGLPWESRTPIGNLISGLSWSLARKQSLGRHDSCVFVRSCLS